MKNRHDAPRRSPREIGEATASRVDETRTRRAYVPPRLEILGDVRDVTLGATPGLGDSSPTNTRN